MRMEILRPQGLEVLTAGLTREKLKTTAKWFDPKPGVAHNPFISITGVSASGKDHLAELVSELTGLKNIGVGSLMAEASGVPGDEVRYLDRKVHFRAKMRAAQKIIELNQSCFINTHLVTKHILVSSSDQEPHISGSPGYLVQGSFDKRINPMHFVAVVSSEQAILDRRLRDIERGRTRDIEDLDTISFHEFLTVVKTRDLAKRFGAGFSLIYNVEDPDTTEENVRFLMNLARDIQK